MSKKLGSPFSAFLQLVSFTSYGSATPTLPYTIECIEFPSGFHYSSPQMSNTFLKCRDTYSFYLLYPPQLHKYASFKNALLTPQTGGFPA